MKVSASPWDVELVVLEARRCEATLEVRVQPAWVDTTLATAARPPPPDGVVVPARSVLLGDLCSQAVAVGVLAEDRGAMIRDVVLRLGLEVARSAELNSQKSFVPYIRTPCRLPSPALARRWPSAPEHLVEESGTDGGVRREHRVSALVQ